MRRKGEQKCMEGRTKWKHKGEQIENKMRQKENKMGEQKGE